MTNIAGHAFMDFFLLPETYVRNRLLDNKKIYIYIIMLITRLCKYRCLLGAHGFMT